MKIDRLARLLDAERVRSRQTQSIDYSLERCHQQVLIYQYVPVINSADFTANDADYSSSCTS